MQCLLLLEWLSGLYIHVMNCMADRMFSMGIRKFNINLIKTRFTLPIGGSKKSCLMVAAYGDPKYGGSKKSSLTLNL